MVACLLLFTFRVVCQGQCLRLVTFSLDYCGDYCITSLQASQSVHLASSRRKRELRHRARGKSTNGTLECILLLVFQTDIFACYGPKLLSLLVGQADFCPHFGLANIVQPLGRFRGVYCRDWHALKIISTRLTLDLFGRGQKNRRQGTFLDGYARVLVPTNVRPQSRLDAAWMDTITCDSCRFESSSKRVGKQNIGKLTATIGFH